MTVPLKRIMAAPPDVSVATVASVKSDSLLKKEQIMAMKAFPS